MAENLDILNAAVSLLIRAALLATGFSGRVRRRSLKRLASRDIDAKAKEILFLKDRVYQLEMQVSILQKHLHKKGKSPRYSAHEKLVILWHMEAFQIPRRRVSRYFGIARSTLYRWLHKIEAQKPSGTPVSKASTEFAAIVWEITKANLSWGRIRIANQLKLLNIFLSASTVRNILQRPKPRKPPTTAASAENIGKAESRAIPASHPNHVWSVDTTKVLCWGLWPIHVCAAIDHFSRKVMCVVPLEGPNAGWIIEALQQAMREHGAPKHMISVASARVLLFEPDHQVDDLLGDLGPPGILAVLAAVVFLCDEFAVPRQNGIRREENRCLLQEFPGQLLGLCGEPPSLGVAQQDAFVLFLLFLQDPDLLFEIIDRLPEFLVTAVRQAGLHRKAQVSSHSPQRIMGQWATGKGYRQIVAQVTEMKKLTFG